MMNGTLAFMSDDRFSLDTLKHLLGILRPNCHIASSDVEFAYDTMFITPQSRTFLVYNLGAGLLCIIAPGWSQFPLIYQILVC